MQELRAFELSKQKAGHGAIRDVVCRCIDLENTAFSCNLENAYERRGTTSLMCRKLTAERRFFLRHTI